MGMPEELVVLIDQQAKLGFITRSEYIRRAVISRLKKEGLVAPLSDGDIHKVAEWARRRRLSRALARTNLKDLRENDEFHPWT